MEGKGRPPTHPSAREGGRQGTAAVQTHSSSRPSASTARSPPRRSPPPIIDHPIDPGMTAHGTIAPPANPGTGYGTHRGHRAPPVLVPWDRHVPLRQPGPQSPFAAAEAGCSPPWCRASGTGHGDEAALLGTHVSPGLAERLKLPPGARGIKLKYREHVEWLRGFALALHKPLITVAWLTGCRGVRNGYPHLQPSSGGGAAARLCPLKLPSHPGPAAGLVSGVLPSAAASQHLQGPSRIPTKLTAPWHRGWRHRTPAHGGDGCSGTGDPGTPQSPTSLRQQPVGQPWLLRHHGESHPPAAALPAGRGAALKEGTESLPCTGDLLP